MDYEIQGNKEKISHPKEKSVKMDEIDREILNLLAKDSRMKLTKISSHVGLSVDAVKARITKLVENGIIEKFTITANVNKLGYSLAIHIYIKLKNISGLSLQEFFKYLKLNPRVIDMMSMLGDYDLYIVILAKDTNDANNMKTEIRQKFNDLIDEWKEVVVSKIHKLEEYRF